VEIHENRLGVVVRGSLSKGLELKLDPEVPLESLRAGMFAIAGGATYDFFSLITDLELTATTPEALEAPPPEPDSLLRFVLAGDSIYSRAVLRPHLMVDRAEEDAGKALLPVKTIPGHFTTVRKAAPDDVDRVFGSEARSPHHFHIGAPLEMDDIPVCLNLEAFAERSNGIFGKSGTGKTFLTRLVLCGLVQKDAAANLIFDMHSEYGWKGTDERAPGGVTKGLRALYPGKVEVFSLDRRPGEQPDYHITIPYSFLEPEDVLSLQKVIGLNPTAAENSFMLAQLFGKQWFSKALEMDAKEVAGEQQAHEGALSAFRRKLGRLAYQCRGFLKPDSEAGRAGEDAVNRIINNLERGIHTVIDFGRYSQLVHYILVANILTRRIDERWREKTEEYLSDPQRCPKPRRVVITIEEAHKFLEPGIAEQTIFGRIARELRKYGVTLLIVDQRPSQIEREVLSQLGTKICCLLDDEADVDAVLAGASGSSGLRSVLASLDTRQQALIFGHALPMPVVVKTRSYDEAFFKSLGWQTGEERSAMTRARREKDFPDE
jgi:DNA helicase HerA-like ATPase